MGKKKKVVKKAAGKPKSFRSARAMLAKLLMENSKKKLTDDQLLALVRRKFPKTKSLKDRGTVRSLRSNLNTNGHAEFGKPRSRLLPYNGHKSTGPRKAKAAKATSNASKKKSKKKKLVKKASAKKKISKKSAKKKKASATS